MFIPRQNFTIGGFVLIFCTPASFVGCTATSAFGGVSFLFAFFGRNRTTVPATTTTTTPTTGQSQPGLGFAATTSITLTVAGLFIAPALLIMIGPEYMP